MSYSREKQNAKKKANAKAALDQKMFKQSERHLYAQEMTSTPAPQEGFLSNTGFG